MSSAATTMKEGIKTLLSALGERATLRRPGSGGSYDSSSGTIVGGSNADEFIRVAFVNHWTNEMDETDVVRAYRKALVSPTYNGQALTKVPQVGDLIVGVGETVTIVSVQTLRPAGVVIGYICRVKT